MKKEAPKGWYYSRKYRRRFSSKDVWDVDVDTPGANYGGFFIKPEVAQRLGIPVTVDDCHVEAIKKKKQWRKYGRRVSST